MKAFTRINSNENRLIEYTQNILFKKIILQCLINCSHLFRNNNRLPSFSSYNKTIALLTTSFFYKQCLVVGGVFMDLSKAFDCVPHDLLIVKLAAYSVDENLLMYIYSYLSNRKQCVRINNVHSKFQNVISGVLQGSIVGPTLFNSFFNDFFYFIDKASVHNFADDNSLGALESNIKNLKLILESESKTVISWFQSNKMIVNPGKFQVLSSIKRNKIILQNTSVSIRKI